jgi:hypothetical protein
LSRADDKKNARIMMAPPSNVGPPDIATHIFHRGNFLGSVPA